MPKRKTSNEENISAGLINKMLPGNKALALSLAVTLALTGVVLPNAAALSSDSGNAGNNKNMVLVHEKDDDKEADWEEDEEQSYSYYGSGGGYSYRPFFYSGSGHAAWVSPKSSKSVGGYNISRGHVGS